MARPYKRVTMLEPAEKHRICISRLRDKMHQGIPLKHMYNEIKATAPNAGFLSSPRFGRFVYCTGNCNPDPYSLQMIYNYVNLEFTHPFPLVHVNGTATNNLGTEITTVATIPIIQPPTNAGHPTGVNELSYYPFVGVADPSKLLQPDTPNECIITLCDVMCQTMRKHFLPTLENWKRKKNVNLSHWDLDSAVAVHRREKHLKDWGIRAIQQGRYELFLYLPVFDAFCKVMLDKFKDILYPIIRAHITFPDAIRRILTDYATELARKDPKVQDDMTFGTFSLIINMGEVLPQVPHIDLLQPQIQFGLFLTKDTRATITYAPCGKAVDSASSFMEFLGVSTEAGSRIGVHLAQDESIRELLQDYGACLSTVVRSQNPNYVVSSQRENVPVGAVISIPGSILHGGPHTDGFRMVLFFTASPDHMEPYNADVQWFDGLLLGELVLRLWNGITVNDRIAILQKLNIVVQRMDTLFLHFHQPECATLQKFMQDIVKAYDVEKMIRDFAKNNTIAG